MSEETHPLNPLLHDMASSINRHSKANRKLKDKINRVTKLVPGLQRIHELDRIAMELELEADEHPEYEDALRNDALFIRRLQWDLYQLRKEVRGTRGGRVAEAEEYFLRERP